MIIKQDAITEHPDWKIEKPTILHSILALIGFPVSGQEIEIETNKQPSEITSSLDTMVDCSWVAQFSGYSKRGYIGYIAKNHFQIYCSPRSPKNSFLDPMLDGIIEPIPCGCRIKAHLGIDPFSKILIASLLCGIIVIVIVNLNQFSLLKTLALFAAIAFLIFLSKIANTTRDPDQDNLIQLLERLTAFDQASN